MTSHMIQRMLMADNLAKGFFSLLFPQNTQEVDKVIHRHDKSRDRLPCSC